MKDLETLDQYLLDTMLRDYEKDLTENQFEAFSEMQSREDRSLSKKQSDWIRAIATKLGIYVPEPENAFSALPPEVQAEHRRMVQTKLPWERGEVAKPLKPPGRRT